MTDNKAELKAKELVEKFMPHVYCYLGSGMLTNDYDENVAKQNAKQCAILAVDLALEYSVKEDTAELLKVKQSINQL